MGERNSDDRKVPKGSYAIIQSWMVNELGLSGNRALTFGIIHSFSMDGESSYYGGVKYLQRWLGVSSHNTVLKILKELTEMGYIEKVDSGKKVNGIPIFVYQTSRSVIEMIECNFTNVSKNDTFQFSTSNVSNNDMNVSKNDMISEETCQKMTSYNKNKDIYKKENCINNISINNIMSSSDPCVVVINYLNEKSNSHYKPNTKGTQKLIKSVLKEFTVDDCKLVIDCKCQDWLKNPKMREYLRPQTLFSGHFEGYLQEALRRKGETYGSNPNNFPEVSGEYFIDYDEEIPLY